ncbi:hypothetical protein VTK26DRAFT_57 [Humicola hyalothermophila]
MRRPKRARDDEDSVAEVVQRRSEEPGVRSGRKKRVKHDTNARRLACPFYKHDSAKYKHVKTCCGPGWEDVHRVKEHVYRRHSLKNLCPRCFEHFDKPEALKSHQRAETPCRLKQMAIDAITEEQEIKLRKRAKAQCSEEEKWEEMYRVIFPDENAPSPYHDTGAEAPPMAESRWKSAEECKEYIRTELPKIVRAGLERYVDELFKDVQEKVNQKAVELIHEVETKMLITFHFREEQAAAPAGDSQQQQHQQQQQPSSRSDPDLYGVGQFLDGMKNDPNFIDFRNSVPYDYDLEDLLAGADHGVSCDEVDSAYYTSSSNGIRLPTGDAAYVSGYVG